MCRASVRLPVTMRQTRRPRTAGGRVKGSTRGSTLDPRRGGQSGKKRPVRAESENSHPAGAHSGAFPLSVRTFSRERSVRQDLHSSCRARAGLSAAIFTGARGGVKGARGAETGPRCAFSRRLASGDGHLARSGRAAPEDGARPSVARRRRRTRMAVPGVVAGGFITAAGGKISPADKRFLELVRGWLYGRTPWSHDSSRPVRCDFARRPRTR